MLKFIANTKAKAQSRSGARRAISIGFVVTIAVSSLISWPAPAFPYDSYNLTFALSPPHDLQGFESHEAMMWGHISTAQPGAKTWQPYEMVPGAGQVGGPEKLQGPLESISAIIGDPRCGFLLTRVCGEPDRPLPEATTSPGDMTAPSQEEPRNHERAAAMLVREEFRVYLVRRGDSLWDIAKRFDMNYQSLARINGLNSGAVLQVGRPLKVEVSLSQELNLNLSSHDLATHPALLEYIRMIDGRPVPHWLITDFVADIIDSRSGELESKDGNGGLDFRTVVIHFQLVRNLLEGRARLYQPMVLTHAEKYDLDPALIMAMIHTESKFNPNARSNASAIGLMQLVPQTAGREAYHRIYGQQRALTPEYLFDPNNNIELGTAYLHILSSRLLSSILLSLVLSL